MKILKIEPNKKPEIVEIDGSLESMKSVVGGWIEAVFPFREAVALICNAEGKLLQLPLNRVLQMPETEQIYDIVCGVCFLCGAPLDSSTFTSLTQEQLEKYMEYYKEPEQFLVTNDRIVVLKKNTTKIINLNFR